MEAFPKEINIEILKNISVDDIINNICKTSKTFRGICSDDIRYKPLWKHKIEEDFLEGYNGDRAFSHYMDLEKIHSQFFYIVYTNDGTLGLFNTYGKAIMAIIDDIIEKHGDRISKEKIRYLLWNSNYISLRDEDEYYSIERIVLDVPENVMDERKFFSDREKLHVDIFGRSSMGKSSIIRNNFNKSSIILPVVGESELSNDRISEIFYELLDKTIKYTNSSRKDPYDLILENFQFFNFNEKQYKIIEKYVLNNTIIEDLERENEGDEDEEDEDE